MTKAPGKAAPPEQTELSPPDPHGPFEDGPTPAPTAEFDGPGGLPMKQPLEPEPKEPPAALAEPKEAPKLEATLMSMAVTPVERWNAYQAADRVRRTAILMSAIKEISRQGWGEKLSLEARAAVGRYCVEIGADPARHVFVLGGNIFINGTYYRDVISANPKFHHATDPVWIHEDRRLGTCAYCGDPLADDMTHGHAGEVGELVKPINMERIKERMRRSEARLRENVDEDSPGICILELHYSDGRGPFKGIGRVRDGTTANGKQKDPVGMESPRESAETRAWREAGEKAEPVWFRNHPALKAAEQLIVEGRRVEQLPPGPQPVAPLPVEE